MKKTSFITQLSITTSFLLCFSCYDFVAHSHKIPLDVYTGKWLFTGSIYDESINIDSTGFITLFEDSTFLADFSYFWNKDSSKSDSVTGSWFPYQTATYRDNYYVDLHLQVNSGKKHWRVHGGTTEGTMTWFKDDYGKNPEFYWSIDN